MEQATKQLQQQKQHRQLQQQQQQQQQHKQYKQQQQSPQHPQKKQKQLDPTRQTYQLNEHQQELLSLPLPQRPRLLDDEDFNMLRLFLMYQGTPKEYRKCLSNYYRTDNQQMVEHLVTPPHSDSDSDSDSNEDEDTGADDDDPILLPD
jgi:hypothetical protein